MKARYLFIIAMVWAGLAILGLRLNASRSLELNNHILSQDLKGASVSNDIAKLRQFVFSHMNSSARFELSGAYERSQANAQAVPVTGKVYSQAQAYCDRQGVSSVDQAVCVQGYLSDRLGDGATPAKAPQRSQYTYAFAAPTWSPDLAGWGILGALLFLVLSLIRYVASQFSSRPYPL